MRSFLTCHSIAAPNNSPKERASSFGNHRNHVNLTALIIMAYATTVHGRYLLTGEGFLFFIGFLVHTAKVIIFFFPHNIVF